MNKKFWYFTGIAILTANTLLVVVLLEMIFFKRPYISIFLIIFACTYFFNKNLFSKRKNQSVARAERRQLI